MKGTFFPSSLKTLRGEWNVRRHWSLCQDLKKKKAATGTTRQPLILWGTGIMSNPGMPKKSAMTVGMSCHFPSICNSCWQKWTWEADTPKLRWQSIHCKSSITQWTMSENDTTEINSLTAPDETENSSTYPIFICYLFICCSNTNQAIGLPPVPSRDSSYR